MRKRYPLTTNGTMEQATMLLSGLPIGSGFSVLAIEEEVQLPMRHGLVAARRMKILRLDRAPSRSDHTAVTQTQVTGRRTTHSRPALEARHELAGHLPKPQATEFRRDGNRLELRSISKVVVDEAG